jgi:hypothetical protein
LFVSVKLLFLVPLIQFLLIGSCIYGLYALSAGNEVNDNERVLIVSAGEIQALADQWTQLWKRPPTSEELAGVVRNHVRTQILYREAESMGLADGDIVIQRRLAQKVEFLTEDFATAVPPTDAEIAAYYDENSENYRIPEGATFSHVYFNADRRGMQGAVAAANELRDRLLASSDPSARPADAGDPFVLPLDFYSRARPEVEELFGATEFTEQVFAARPAQWTGPLLSAYGVHIVYVHETTPSRLPALEDVRGEARRDLVSQRRRKANETFYNSMLGKYTVIIETEGDE